MDTRKLAEILRATIDPNQRQQAEDQLTQVILNDHPHVQHIYNTTKFNSMSYERHPFVFSFILTNL